MEVQVQRLTSAPENAEHRATTTGVVFIDGSQVCFSLERTDTLMPTGTFPLKLLPSKRFQRLTPHLEVPGHTEVEMHGANTAEDVHGCVGVAEKRLDDYTIYESAPATNAIENSLRLAEANNEVNTITIS